jgi:hypothetical protein
MSNVLLVKTPPEKTNYIQWVDDNVGRIFRDDACSFLEEEVSNMDIEKRNKLSAEEKRELMVRAAEMALKEWKNSPHHQEIGRKAALRTGLSMRIDNNCDGVVPNRFPTDYAQSILPSSGAPVKPYYIRSEMQPVAAITSVTTTATTALGTLSVSAANLTSNAVVVAEASALPQPTLAVSLRSSLTPPLTGAEVSRETEEVHQDDGWSDEEDRVFLNDEVAAESSDESEEESAPYARRIGKRNRWCLFGCDCERDRGRKCYCELRGDGGCSEKCLCDPAKCRARVSNENSDE